MNQILATCIGLSAIVLWASIVALIKQSALLLGAELAILLIYSLSALLLLIFFGLPNFKKIPIRFLCISTLLFVAYEFCLSYAIALTTSERQAIEVSIVNYLWPTFTIIALILNGDFQFKWSIFLGLSLSFFGVAYIQFGSTGFALAPLVQNLSANLWVYIFALSGAIIWALYCVLTRQYKIQENPIAFYFLIIAVLMWSKFFILGGSLDVLQRLDWHSGLYVFLAAFTLSLGYAAWNIGIVKGNISLLVACSYFTPILSSILAVWILATTLPTTFWQGVVAVTIGSIICWLSTNNLYLEPRLRKTLRQLKLWIWG